MSENSRSSEFSKAERDAVYRAIEERRDMRHFAKGTVEPQTLHRVLQAAHHAPSVGFMQPWRILRITDQQLRTKIHAHVQDEVEKTAEAVEDRKSAFMRLKLEGIADCAELLVVALMEDRGQPRYQLGRRTMPEMDLASTACAIQNMWLAARAESLGLGWVSFFEPNTLGKMLGCPADAYPIAIICLGPVTEFYPRPMLEDQGWAKRHPLSEVYFENTWAAKPTT